MKKIGIVVIILTLLIVYFYVCNITFLPSSYILMQGESLNIFTLAGLFLQEKDFPYTFQTVSNTNQTKVNKIGKINYSLNLFNIFPIKNINVNVIPKSTVVPVGRAIGMKLYTEGVLVVGMSEIEGKKPYENSGIQEGDRIIEINQDAIESTEDLMQVVNNSKRKCAFYKIYS